MSQVLLLGLLLAVVLSPIHHDEDRIKQLEQRVSVLEEWVVYLIAMLQRGGFIVTPETSAAPQATPTPQSATCPTSADVQWVMAQDLARHWEISVNDPRIARAMPDYSVYYSSVSYFCSSYKALGNIVVRDFASRWPESKVFRTHIYCTVRKSLSKEQLYHFRNRFEFRKSLDSYAPAYYLISECA